MDVFIDKNPIKNFELPSPTEFIPPTFFTTIHDDLQQEVEPKQEDCEEEPRSSARLARRREEMEASITELELEIAEALQMANEALEEANS
eukprot:CAMPEP_0172461122 /NCGR_PEP_ID=MMETSP1065-20121228/39504_1 /TAXON_ID=265537 /ORGANISM="Amphiprora paludosa, Strain CCMP125" /LENGTH=89 /DNA_ID=CAMNT_0013216347 /DNA_START=11 /DNA_END=280 /DNA_ORIENTATION=+